MINDNERSIEYLPLNPGININLKLDVDLLSKNDFPEDLLMESNCSDIQDEEICNFEYEYDFDCESRIYNDEIDLSAADCLSDDDFGQNLWIVGDLETDDIMDYFWEGENLCLCQTPDGGFYLEYIFNLNEEGHQDKYKFKYLCTEDGFSYRLCNKESCDLCEFFGGRRVINNDYILYQKYVEPIE
jgi:hypothetical protein